MQLADDLGCVAVRCQPSVNRLTDLVNKETRNSCILLCAKTCACSYLQLLDLCILEVGCLQFPYSVVAASALFHMTSQELALEVTGTKCLDCNIHTQWLLAGVE